MFKIKLLLKMKILFFSNATHLKQTIQMTYQKIGIGDYVEFQLFQIPKTNDSSHKASHKDSDMNVGDIKIVGSF